MLKMIIVCHLTALIFTTGLLVHCPQRGFVGINIGYDELDIHSNGEHQVQDSCNADCYCQSEFNPICEQSTGHMYFSPCYAGCRSKSEQGGKTEWTDCQCLETNFTHGYEDHQHDTTLHGGYCEIDCGFNIYILMGTLFITVVASFASGIPTQQVF
ncbi:hypothetical protein COOONC_14752 [Cooperia oncophora]